MPYFTLCTRHTDGHYYPQFGDRDRKVVAQEQRDEYRGRAAIIVKSKTAFKRDIDAAIIAAEAAELAKVVAGINAHAVRLEAPQVTAAQFSDGAAALKLLARLTSLAKSGWNESTMVEVLNDAADAAYA